MNEERDIDYFELGRLIHICRSRPIQILDDFEDDGCYIGVLNVCDADSYETIEANFMIDSIVENAAFPRGRWSLNV
jgi:hypothetical protein